MDTQKYLASKVGELVAQDYRKATVFKKYGIDFCCGGGKSIDEVCKKKNVNAEELINELIALENQQEKPQHDFNSWDLGFLADYIVNTHHKYVEESLPVLLEFSDKVAKVHGHANPEVIEINQLVHASAQELSMHMRKEEMILFPYIQQLEKAIKNGEPKPVAGFGTVQNPINMMEHEHDLVGDYFKKIDELSSGYLPPEHACNTYRVLYAKLKEFEDDLHQHIHLENNILFPKAIKLEQA